MKIPLLRLERVRARIADDSCGQQEQKTIKVTVLSSPTRRAVNGVQAGVKMRTVRVGTPDADSRQTVQPAGAEHNQSDGSEESCAGA